jgi:filamentous hemagglutinin family protein
MNLPEQEFSTRSRPSSVPGLLGSAGLALLVLGALAPHARAAGALSQGNLGIAPVASSLAANLAAEQQAQSVGLQAQNQLSRISMAMQAMQNLQTAAHNLALNGPSPVPDGLAANGLVPDSGLAAPGVANPVTWTGAQTPVQANVSGRTTVTINQTAAQALLSWNSFNVGRNTTVNFNQQGNSNWVALNQISPTGVPSHILGSIQASGQVYLINPNGIIFGGASQVNVGALIASSAQIGISSQVSQADSSFLANGIYGPNPGITPSFTGAGGTMPGGNIIVQPGAVIATSAPAIVSAGGGFVLMMGKQVVNGGSISTPVGQTELAAGDNFYLRPGYSTTSNDSSTTRGNEIAVKLNTNGSSLTGGSGLVQNNGEITAATGDITLAGETVQQNGIALSTTSVAYRGTIHLLSSATDRFAAVTLGSNAYTLIEPDLSSSATGLDSQRAGLLADAANANSIRQAAISGVFNDLSPLGDLEDESRIEIVSGNTVEFQSGSDSSAPGGQIAVYAANRVQVDTGALLDVSGSYAVPVAMASNDLPVNIQNFELRDNPQNRLTGSLSNSTVFVNAQDVSLVPASATDPNTRQYSAGGLFEVSGYIANTGHTIGEYTAVGGSITLETGAKGAVVADAGSTFNIDGGSLDFSSGYLQQSYLLATNGQVYNANNAPAYLTYAGVYHGFTDNHARWNVTQTYADILKAPPEIFQQGYLVGRAAGTLTLSSPTSIFNGTIEASTANGPMQTAADPAGVTDPYLYTQSEVAAPGNLVVGDLVAANLTLGQSNVIFGSAAPQAGAISDPIPKILDNTTILSAATINDAGLGGLEVLTNGSVKVAAPLSFAPGAAVSLYGSSINIAANVTAAGGSFTASQVAPGQQVAQSSRSSAGIVVGNNATISTAGLWTNLALDPNVTFTQAFINGGAVDIASIDNLTLHPGTTIDASAGGSSGLRGSVKAGTGGAITLEAAAPNPLTTTPVGNLKLGATLESVGATGGALTLYAPHFLISDTGLTPPPSSVVQLDPSFFTQGFSAYNLLSPGDIVVTPGTVVNVTEPTYLTTAATPSVPTGAVPGSAFALTLQPLYTANTTATAITQRAGASFSAEIVSPLPADPSGRSFIDHTTLLIGDNAAINVDPGQSIKLQSVSQLTVDGSLNAPGGTISATSLYNTQAALPGPGTVSIWLGPNAVLNASAQPVSFENTQGNRISLAPAGGTIVLGTNTSTASVIIRQGALVEASGSAATDRMTASALNTNNNTAQPVAQAIPVEGAGGAISLASEEGIYNNGTLVAAAGGPNAAGGSLTMALEPDLLPNATNTAEATPRIFVITQYTPDGTLPAHLKPGSSKGLTIGTAALSQQQITEGGFGSVTLFTRDAFRFQGNVTLSAPQSITLEEGYLTDSSKHGSVTLDAPYVMLSGNTPGDTGPAGNNISLISGFSARQATGIFTVNAAMIAINNSVRFGGLLPGSNGSVIDLAGFGAVQLNATGDLQFVAPNDYGGDNATGNLNNLVTTANLTLTAREIYALDPTGPQIGVYNPTRALVIAGYNPVASTANGNFNPKKVLTIRQSPGTVAAAPDTLSGILTFAAPTINQGGVVWQPFGSVNFGEISSGSVDGFNFTGDPKGTVNFLPGSITSVSAAGLNVPFGGTTDGVTYDVNGSAIGTAGGSLGLSMVTGGAVPGSITIAALNTDIQPGATIDLRGGGTLTGAGFISGENGSTDVLTTPLLNIGTSGVSQPGIGTNPVYAIMTGAQAQAAVAYTQSGATGSTPGLGQQIIIPAGVPGLPAGAYTLLPAQYALEPGGYRVELDGAAALDAAPVAGLPNGSYAVAGYTALAGTNVRATLATNVTITPGATVLHYAGYDTEGYSPFLLANATRLDELRPTLPIDAGTLVLNVPTSQHVSLINTGSVDFAAAAGGLGGVLQIFSLNANVNDLPIFDIYNTAPAGLRRNMVALSAPQIDAFHPYILEIGKPGSANPGVKGITLESGATLTAARVVLSAQTGGITLDSGSGIDTINQGTLPVDSTTEGLLSNNGVSVLDVGNGYLVYGTTPVTGATYGPITIQNGAFIYTDGSIAFSTSGAVNIGTGASYGGKYIDLAVPVINIGDTTGLGANAPAGVALTEAELQALTAGVPNLGVPAVQIVNLTAFDSLNFYGNAGLDLTASGVQLEINTPAIYGYGSGADVATIAANTIVWNGIPTSAAIGNTVISTQPGATNPQGPGSGSGTLDLQASTIILGFSPLDLPQRDVSLIRLTAGFSTVNFDASSEITANNQGTLAVYQTVATYGKPGSNGTLNLNTPLLTADNGAVIGITAGNNITLSSYPGAVNATSQVSEAAGGEIDLTAGTIALGSSVILPSGKLNLQASGNIGLGAGSLLDLAGAVTQNNDQTVYGFGGDLVMASATGDITQAPGSVINVGATNNTAGSVSITATDAANGQVALLGTLQGASTGGFAGGAFSVEAQNIVDFATLNTNLDAGGFFQSRSFDIKQGDLSIGNGLEAQNVSVSLDNGSLTVTGLIDASFGGGGTINLAASNNLTLAGSAVLDAHGTVLQTDSTGAPIASENAPAVTLTSNNGLLTLGSGATLKLASADSIARGDLELNAARTGASGPSATDGQSIADPVDGNVTTGAIGPANAQGNNIAISASGPLNITGAATIALNGTATYKNAPPDPNDPNGQLIDQPFLDLINTDSIAFENAALTNPALASQITGLTAYRSAFHLRPGVQIVSGKPNGDANPTGDLTVEGDINLVGYRYGPGAVNFNPDQQMVANPGAGEPGTLAIRAGGNLNIYGSITDGFAQPVSDTGTEFAKGWVIFGGKQQYQQIQVLPMPITVTTGSTLPANAVVNFAVPIATGGRLEIGAAAPVPLTVDGDQHTQTAFTATSAILTSGGQTLFAQGQLVPAHSLIPDGSVIEAGGSLPFAVRVDQVMWPANTPLTVTSNVGYGDGIAVKLGIDTAITTGRNAGAILPANAVIPAGSVLEFAPNTPGLTRPLNSQGQPLRLADGTLAPETVNTRLPANGSQGQLYALAPQLPAGDLSWGIDLVAGADTAAAGTNVVQAASSLGDSGNIVLADAHYGVDLNNTHPHNVTETVVPAFSVVRTGTGALTLAAGGSINEESSFGVYTAGTQSAGVASNDNLPQGTTKDGTVLGAQNAGLNALIANYAAYYPTNGGNVLVSAQGDLNGFINIGNSYQPYVAFTPVNLTDSDAIGGWLWLQGGAGQTGAWWTNFGALDLAPGSKTVQMTGFQGIGTLGGGNLTVNAGGNASGLDLVVASNGRVTPIGTLENGGGALNASIGGTVNFTQAVQSPVNITSSQDAGGVISDLRGIVAFNAGSIGTVQPIFNQQKNGADPRFLSPLASEVAGFGNGFDLALGDSTATVNTRGDLAIGNAINPGTVQNFVNATPVAGFAEGSRGVTDFSLWTASTSTGLFSAGGDVAPVAPPGGVSAGQNDTNQFFYTPSLLATAQNGNIYIAPTSRSGQSQELAPSPIGQLQLLAADSVIGINNPILSISGAPLSLVATPSDPGITVTSPSGGALFTNISPLSQAEPLDFGLDTTTGPLHANDSQPARIYAATGDVLGIQFGVFLPAGNGQSQQVIAAKPFDIFAGRDIVDTGTLLTPDIFLNLNATDISSVTAGRDIIQSSFDIAGPGNLVVQAGRNFYQADQGAIVSLGRVFGITPANRDTGAGVTVLAGVGSGPDYSVFETAFLNPDPTGAAELNNVSKILQVNPPALLAWLQANAQYTGSEADMYVFFLSLPIEEQNAFLSLTNLPNLTDPSQIIQQNEAALTTWLESNTGYNSSEPAFAYFASLPAAQQAIFLRQLYFTVLNNSGLDFNDPSSNFFKSYLLGKTAIGALFPANIATSATPPDTGDITLFGPSGVQTLFGGTIQALTPGGNTIVGVEGTTPPSTAGFITQGSGDINIYAQDSVLLGESRVITTFGGNIVVWSALGNINAGRGSKTTIDFTPVQRIYDNYGNVFLSPTVPSNGAGIATLAPIPGVPPGNINLVAPAGTVDAGEAGIRGSGNLNIAALHVLNAANINVQGSSTGVPTAAAPDVGGLTSAGNAAGAAAQAAENAAPKQQAQPMPSIWIVEILGYGGGSQPNDQDMKKKKKQQQTISSLSPGQTIQPSLF